MMGERKVQQDALFYEFSLEPHVPEKHLLRAIDGFVELDGLRRELEPFYSAIGRPSIDPELMIRMLIVGALVQMAAADQLHWRAELAEVVDGQAEGGSGAVRGSPLRPRSHHPVRARQVRTGLPAGG